MPRDFAKVFGDEVVQVQVEDDGDCLADSVPSRNEEIWCRGFHVFKYVLGDQGVGTEDKLSLVCK